MNKASYTERPATCSAGNQMRWQFGDLNKKDFTVGPSQCISHVEKPPSDTSGSLGTKVKAW